MKRVKNLEEATEHFQNGFDAIICEKEGAEPVEVTGLEQAREFYGFEAPAEPPRVPSVGETRAKELIAESFGKVSMAWSETPKGVFNDELVKAEVDALYDKLFGIQDVTGE